MIRMSLLDQMSHWSGDPQAARRPFDTRRARPGSRARAGIIILEEYEHARARGARIYGEILGYGAGCDARPGGGIDPEGAGTEIAIRARRSGTRGSIRPGSATSTPTARGRSTPT